jgi:hypothetical protein
MRNKFTPSVDLDIVNEYEVAGEKIRTRRLSPAG